MIFPIHLFTALYNYDYIESGLADSCMDDCELLFGTSAWLFDLEYIIQIHVLLDRLGIASLVLYIVDVTWKKKIECYSTV